MDWPQNLGDFAANGLLSTAGAGSPVTDMAPLVNNTQSTAAWPTLSMALYVPVIVRQPVTVTALAWNIGTPSGNMDAGIYDSEQKQIVHTGSIVQAAGITVTSIASTLLAPALYYLALVADNVTGTSTRIAAPGANVLRATGCAQQATAFPLPSPATFAAMGSNFTPLVMAQIASAL